MYSFMDGYTQTLTLMARKSSLPYSRVFTKDVSTVSDADSLLGDMMTVLGGNSCIENRLNTYLE